MLLSPREREVLQAFVEGMTTDEVVEHLAISIHTVRAHLKNVMQALRAHSKLEAIIRAVQAGLITLSARPEHPAPRAGHPVEIPASTCGPARASSSSAATPLDTLVGWTRVEREPAGWESQRSCLGTTCSVRLIASTQGTLILLHVLGEGRAPEIVAQLSTHDRPAVPVLDWLSEHLAALHTCGEAAANRRTPARVGPPGATGRLQRSRGAGWRRGMGRPPTRGPREYS
jgi:DNA-binding CsgD family transcriptional regulator